MDTLPETRLKPRFVSEPPDFFAVVRQMGGQLLGHAKLEPTVRYLGIEVGDALEISEQSEI